MFICGSANLGQLWGHVSLWRQSCFYSVKSALWQLQVNWNKNKKSAQTHTSSIHSPGTTLIHHSFSSISLIFFFSSSSAQMLFGGQKSWQHMDEIPIQKEKKDRHYKTSLWMFKSLIYFKLNHRTNWCDVIFESKISFSRIFKLPLDHGDYIIGRCGSEALPSLIWKSSLVHVFSGCHGAKISVVSTNASKFW